MSVVITQIIFKNKVFVDELKIIKNRFGQSSLINSNIRLTQMILLSLLFYSLILGAFLGIFGTRQNEGYYGPGSLGIILTNFGKVFTIGITGIITIIVVNVFWCNFNHYRRKSVDD